MTNGVYWLSIRIDKKDCFTDLGESKCRTSRNAPAGIRAARTYATTACIAWNTPRIPMIAYEAAQPHAVMTVDGERLAHCSYGGIRSVRNANARDN